MRIPKALLAVAAVQVTALFVLFACKPRNRSSSFASTSVLNGLFDPQAYAQGVSLVPKCIDIKVPTMNAAWGTKDDILRSAFVPTFEQAASSSLCVPGTVTLTPEVASRSTRGYAMCCFVVSNS